MRSTTYVCVKDRFTWKHDIWFWHLNKTLNCPLCGQSGRNMGRNWRAPKKNNDRAWRAIERGHKLWENPAEKPKPIIKFTVRSRGRGKIIRIDE